MGGLVVCVLGRILCERGGSREIGRRQWVRSVGSG